MYNILPKRKNVVFIYYILSINLCCQWFCLTCVNTPLNNSHNLGYSVSLPIFLYKKYVMGDNYNFDIESYTEDDLFTLFQIKNGDSVHDIHAKFRKNMLNSIQEQQREEFTTFLQEAQSKIINAIAKYNSDIEYIPLAEPNEVVTNHAVIIPKEINVKNTYDYQFPQGAFNPVERKTIKKIVCIDSLFRNNESSTKSNSFTISLPEEIDKVVSMSLISIDLPNNWYIITDKCDKNKFTINTYDISGVPNAQHTIVVPPGNYMSTSMVSTLNNYFSNIGNGLEYIYVAIDNITGKTVFRAKTSPDPGNPTYPFDATSPFYSPNFRFTLQFSSHIDSNNKCCNVYNSDYDSIGWMLGFRNTMYNVTKNDIYVDNTTFSNMIVTYKCYLESESIYGDSVHDYIFFDVDDYNNNFISNTITSVTANDYIGKNILARIPITTPHYRIENNNAGDNVFKQRDYFGPVKIEKLNVRLLNKFGNLIDLHESNYSFALEFTILYS